MDQLTVFHLISLILATFSGLLLAGFFNSLKRSELEKKSSKIISAAKHRSQELQADFAEYKQRSLAKIKSLQDAFEQNSVLLNKRIELKEATLSKRESKNEKLGVSLNDLEQTITGLKIQTAQKREMLENSLTNKASMTLGEAKEEILNGLERDFHPFFELMGNKYVENTKDDANKQAIHHLKSIMQKYSEPSSVDHLDKTIKVTKDVMKGRLIGRGAKNLIYIEEKTGVDIIFEDQPGIITVSCFNLVIQETVRIAIQKLMRLEKIDFEAIDVALESAKAELDQKLEQIGNKAANIIGIENRDPELMKLIGRLKYRTSYGQNILYHSMEIAYFSALMAAEIGADVEVAKIGGFFHDIGKAIDQEVNGSHDYLGKEILEKFGYSWEIVHAAWTHHDAIPIETVEAQLVKAADAISAGRPGARTESAQMYIERIQGLEKIALATRGVKKAFALSAGREIRTIIDENKIKDDELELLAEKMASEIEDNLAYPGKIKVNLIRTIEAIDYANRGANKSNNT